MTDAIVPVGIPIAADSLIAQYGAGTAVVQLAWGTASPPTDGTASMPVAPGKEHYDFALTGVSAAHWYRWRVGNGSTFHDWSPSFQTPVAYATRQEFLRGLDLPDESRYDEIDGLLAQATDDITEHVCGGRRFFRDPLVGMSTFTLHVEHWWQSKLSLARGRELDIVEVTELALASFTGSGFVTLGADEWALWPDVGPATDIILTGTGEWPVFPHGAATVRITGALGWAEVPGLVRRATVDLARHWWNNRDQGSEPVGLNTMGGPIFGSAPKSVRDLARSSYAWRKIIG